MLSVLAGQDTETPVFSSCAAALAASVAQNLLLIVKLKKILIDPVFTGVRSGGNENAVWPFRNCELPGRFPVDEIRAAGDHDFLSDVVLLIASE